ncbi:MAG: hypothetical protein Fur0025_05180 [Oscillatoriaceae cyanobacterium]
MTNAIKHPLQPTSALSEDLSERANQPKSPWKKLRGGVLFVLGYLLSPLSWWNDLVFNLPLAYLFGYICSWVNRDWLLPGAIAGYWFSNIAGILLMQAGIIDTFQDNSQERNPKKELLTGLASATAYTVLIVTLIQLKILENPELLLSKALTNISALLSALH